jgi:hypothetical protein
MKPVWALKLIGAWRFFLAAGLLARQSAATIF